jgi:hypothetical protein
MIDLSFTFTETVWKTNAPNTWYFVTLPKDKSEEIKFFTDHLYGKRRGWGSVRVRVTIGDSVWETSIFPDSKVGAYLLPVKTSVRKIEKITSGDSVTVKLKINV